MSNYFCFYHQKSEPLPEKPYIQCGECMHVFTRMEFIWEDSKHRPGKLLKADDIHFCPYCQHNI